MKINNKIEPAEDFIKRKIGSLKQIILLK